MRQFIAGIKRYFLYRQRRKLWLKSHEPIEVTTPTLARRVFIDMSNPYNARRMKLFNRRQQLKMKQVFKELNNEL